MGREVEGGGEANDVEGEKRNGEESSLCRCVVATTFLPRGGVLIGGVRVQKRQT